MRSLQVWLDDYGADHLHPTNRKIHRVCVPLIFFAVVGLLHLLPSHAGDALIVLALAWYALLGPKAIALMLAQLGVAIGLVEGLHLTAPLLVGLFVVGWIGQFYGHHLEGRRPSFLRDLQYLLIGPLWVWLGRH